MKEISTVVYFVSSFKSIIKKHTKYRRNFSDSPPILSMFINLKIVEYSYAYAKNPREFVAYNPNEIYFTSKYSSIP